MNDEEKITFDVDDNELANQIKQEIYDSESFAEANILVPTVCSDEGLSDAYPMVEVHSSNTNPVTVALLCLSLEDTIKRLCEEYEGVEPAYKFLKLARNGSKTVSFDDLRNRKEKDNE